MRVVLPRNVSDIDHFRCIFQIFAEGTNSNAGKIQYKKK